MSEKKNLDELRAYLAKTRGERYPLLGHRLAQEDDYIKNLYLKHLGTVTHAGKGIEEPQRLFLQRLVSGCEAESSWDDYLRQGGEATAESLEQLFAQLAAKGLREAFLLDAMLLLHLGSEDRECLDFLAELCEAMRIKTTDAENVARLCAGILTQDTEACLEIDPELDHWCPYFSDEAPLALKDTGTDLIAMAAQPTNVTCADLEKLGQPLENMLYIDEGYDVDRGISFPTHGKIILRNLNIPVDRHLHFSAPEVEFVNCTFFGDDKELADASSLWFKGCTKIVIRSCKFRGFGGRVMYVRNCGEVVIEDSVFANCVVRYRYNSSDWREFGAIIREQFQNGAIPLYLRRCRFINCGGHNTANYYVSSVLSNCKASVFNCVFQRCRHLHDKTTPDDENSIQCCLFKHLIEESGNELTESTRLKPR